MTKLKLGLAAAAVVATARVAHADENNDFAIERFRWSANSDGVLSAESGRVGKPKELTLGAWLGYANDPLVFYTTDADGDRARIGALVHHRVGGALVASLALWHRLELGIEIPFVLYQFRSSNFAGSAQPLASLDKLGLGDISLAPKVSLLRQAKHGVDLALIPAFAVPSGGASNYFGDSGLTFLPELAVSRHWGAAGKLRTLFNLGYRARKNTATANLRIGDELGARLGLGYPVMTLSNHRAVDVGITLSAAMNAYNATNSTFNQVPMEANLGVTLPLGGLDVLVAGGLGLQSGFGSPDWRTVLGVRYHNAGEAAHVAAAEKPSPKVVDTDHDGLVDTVDKCATEAEDVDGFEDTDGCPDADNDRDGVADQADKCPVEAGPAENNGCADTDGDHDGIVDRLDKCPTEAEDKDGTDDNDGCVDPDNDQDGVLDAADRCPVQAGIADNFGCPDQDQDNDGIVDRLDNCPTEAGTAKNNGCKDKQLVAVRNGAIEILEQVFFDTNKAKIQKRSNKLLDNVAKVMLAHNELKFEVQGHTDDRGDDNANLDLSSRRAAAVVVYLTSKGVPADHLESKGFGETQPIADNKSAKGRAKNRRVVFKIVGAPASTIETHDNGPTGPIQDKSK